MSVFVGIPQKIRGITMPDEVCYMTASSEVELMTFAVEALNLRPQWIHKDDIGPYFLLAPHKRKLAIRRGAIALTVKR